MDIRERSVIDVLHSEMGYDLPNAYAIGLALEKRNHQPEAGLLDDLREENKQMIKDSCIRLAISMLEEAEEI